MAADGTVFNRQMSEVNSARMAHFNSADYNHKLRQLVRKLPIPTLDRLRSIYSDYRDQYGPTFRMKEAHVHGVKELELDWETFDRFIENLDKQKFIVGRYAEPREYGIFQSHSAKRSAEMNSYIASDDFFVLGDRILAYKPNPDDYKGNYIQDDPNRG